MGSSYENLRQRKLLAIRCTMYIRTHSDLMLICPFSELYLDGNALTPAPIVELLTLKTRLLKYSIHTRTGYNYSHLYIIYIPLSRLQAYNKQSLPVTRYVRGRRDIKHT